MQEFKEKFKIDELLIKKVGSWNISLRPKQVTIGSLVLSLDRKCPHLGEITNREAQEMAKAFKEVENLLKRTFQPNKINYLALMMVDHQVHFHVIPRYKNKIKFEEREYIDIDWPKPPVLSNTLKLTNKELLLVKNSFK